MDLERFDLNLLRVFEALYRERSVTRAGERLGLSQSAVSNALARLRALLDDELFVRTPGGMEPTLLAATLDEPFRRALDGVRQALALRAPFDPARATESFVVGMSDYAEIVLAPELLRRTRVEAPGMAIAVRHVDRGSAFAMLDAGTLHLAAAVLPEPPPHMTRVHLMREHLVVVMAAQHPLASEEVTLERFIASPHLLVSPTGSRSGAVDRALARLGRERRVLATSASLLAAGPMLRSGDLICTMPERAARLVAGAFDLVVRTLPVTTEAARLSCVYHLRHEQAPAHAWLRRALASIARALPGLPAEDAQ